MSDTQAPDEPPVEDDAAAEPEEEQAAPAEDQSERIAHLEDQHRRALAEQDNMRKRFRRDLDRELRAERARVAADWLPVVDNLELALDHADDESAALVQGLRAVHEQAVATLARLGFPRFEALGQTFDPTVHEAVSMVPDEAPDGTIIAVVRPGYGTSDALLRPAGVVVSRR